MSNHTEAPNASMRVNTDEQQNSPFQTLTDMLHMGFINGCVHTMDHITSTYSSLLNMSGMDSNVRSHYSKNKLFAHFEEALCFQQQGNINQPLLVFGAVPTGEAVEALKTAASQL